MDPGGVPELFSRTTRIRCCCTDRHGLLVILTSKPPGDVAICQSCLGIGFTNTVSCPDLRGVLEGEWLSYLLGRTKQRKATPTLRGARAVLVPHVGASTGGAAPAHRAAEYSDTVLCERRDHAPLG